MTDLRQSVIQFLTVNNLALCFDVGSSASAVDITPKNVNKLSGLEAVIFELKKINKNIKKDNQYDFVAIGEHTSDIPVLEKSKRAYCPGNSSDFVRQILEKNGMKKNVISKEYVDVILEALERECGLKFPDIEIID